jgi:UDP-sulfoquinovose synthase
LNSSTAITTPSPKKIIVLGGDGFCGWPTSLHLSDQGHEIIILDNLSRRKIDIELGCDSLTPIATIEQRIEAWKEVSGKVIRFENLDLSVEYHELVQLLKDEKPDAVVHFAEQRAAPYSMKNSKNKRYTMQNNLVGTNNLLSAIVESGLDIHVVHLGTMGVYGYGTTGGAIPEGYMDIHLPTGDTKSILHPANPGSIYHLTKCLDALTFQFYNKNDGLRITDLHQGIVWGTNTQQTSRDSRLINRFDYDGDYGTVLNRFLMQAALGIPLTVYGIGGQTRAFIHISGQPTFPSFPLPVLSFPFLILISCLSFEDTVRCVEIAINHPPPHGHKVEIFNQVAETLQVEALASLISLKAGVPINYLPNPRSEDPKNSLEVKNQKFCSLGLNPTLLEDGLLDEVVNVARKYKHRALLTKVMPTSYWNRARQNASAGYQYNYTAPPVEKDEF